MQKVNERTYEPFYWLTEASQTFLSRGYLQEGESAKERIREIANRAESILGEEGFADIEKYLKLIKNTNSNFKILFEHKSEVISYKELQECYEYIKTIIN